MYVRAEPAPEENRWGLRSGTANKITRHPTKVAQSRLKTQNSYRFEEQQFTFGGHSSPPPGLP